MCINLLSSVWTRKSNNWKQDFYYLKMVLEMADMTLTQWSYREEFPRQERREEGKEMKENGDDFWERKLVCKWVVMGVPPSRMFCGGLEMKQL